MKSNSIHPSIMVVGAYGKMGSLACEAIENAKRFEAIFKVGRQDNLMESIKTTAPDIILDLSRSDCVYPHCLEYLSQSAPFVIGSSGLTASQIEHIKEVCDQKKQGGLIVPNFSIGAVLQMHFAKVAAKWFDGVDIIEMHHHLKLDSPSGTAIHTAEAIHQNKSEWPHVSHTPAPGRETFHHQIPIHSVRMPGILAAQQVMFGQMGETLQINHQIIDRKAYMPGLLLALEKVQEINQLICGLESWLL